MARKFFAGFLVILSSIILGLCVAGIIMVWEYNEPFTQACLNQLKGIDSELALVQTVLTNAQSEMEGALQIVESAEKAIAGLNINGTLDKEIIPGLKTSQERISMAKGTLQAVRSTLEQINSLPFLSFSAPIKTTVENLIANTATLDTEILQVEGMIQKASTFVTDSAVLLRENYADTKQNLKNFLEAINLYEQKVSGWRAQVAMLLKALPGWIDGTCIALTILMVWFGVSQVGLLRLGLYILHGRRPLDKPGLTEVVIDYEI